MNESNVPQPVSYAPPALPSSTLATVSMIAGILGFTAFPPIGGIVALITGYMARKETRAVPPTVSGDGMATAGIVMGWIQVALAVVGFCCIVAYLVFAIAIARSSYH